MSALLKAQRLLWAAILSATFVFAGLLFVGVRGHGEPPDRVLAPVLALLALGLAATSVIVPRKIHRHAASRLELATVLEPDPHAEAPIHQRQPAMRKVAANPEQARQRAARIFQAPFILSLSLSEAIGLFGFVLGFLGFELVIALPFLILCWMLIVLRYPTEDRILEPVERVLGVRIPRSEA